MSRRRLVNASEERDHFYDLIGKEVTFASEIITIGGQISHTKGEKAVISDVAYVTGFWSNLCPDIYNKPKISTIRINGVEHTCWIPDTFEEFRAADYQVFITKPVNQD